MPFTTIRQQSIYYEQDGKGPPLLLIAGYSCDLTFWTPVREELARHFTLVLFDNPGIGRSAIPQDNLTIEQMAEDALALLDALNIDKPHVLGHSMGGAIAQALALEAPARINRTIFAQTFLKISTASKTIMRALLHLYEDGVPFRRRVELMMPWLFSDPFLDNPSFCEQFFAFQENNPYKPTLKGLTKQYEALVRFDSRGWCSGISTPALVIGSGRDRLFSSEESRFLAQAIPYAKLHMLPNAGHVAPIEQPLEFCKCVCEFLKT